MVDMIQEVAPQVVGLIVMAGMVEAVLEHLVVPALKKAGVETELRELLIKWTSGLIGILGCASFGVDILSSALELLEIEPAYPPIAQWFGIVLTGLLIARGAQSIHDFAMRYFGLDGGVVPPYVDKD